MRKTMKYETPEIEITRFELETGIMDGAIIPGGGSGEDGDIIEIPEEGLSDPDAGDLWGDLGL